MYHNLIYILIKLIIFIGPTTLASQVLRPRGVSLSRASFYNPSREFTCFDGSGKIPFKYVNDDYCDCQDGSDEPGTAACPNGTFFCNNIGHSPTDLPSSRVNDGICDCCDASDEYDSSSVCTDVCLELGYVAREEAKKAMEERQKGYVLKLQMIQEASNIKKEKQAKLEELRLHQDESQATKDIKEQLKISAEEPENLALETYRADEAEVKAKEDAEIKVKQETEARGAFGKLDTDIDGILSMEEMKANLAFDTNRDGQVSDDEAKFYLQQEETMDWDKFLATGWQLMRPVYLLEKQVFTPPTPHPLLDHADQMTPPEEEEQQQEDEESMDDTEEDEYSSEQEDLDDESEDDREEGEEHEEEEVEEVEETQKYDADTQLLVDSANVARTEYNEADKKLKEIQRDIENIEGSLNKDYGPNDEFRVMESHCFDFNDREYTYTLCPFDRAVQKSKNGHGEVRLGQWGDWVGIANDKYAAMKYTNGQACWNGPARSAEVHLTCGTENQLTAVSEPNRCEYLYQFITPAACLQVGDDHIHTEL